MLYLGHSFGWGLGAYRSAEKQSVYSTAPAEWATLTLVKQPVSVKENYRIQISYTPYINMRLVKAWNAIDELSIIWKSDLFDKIKRYYF